MKSTIKKITDEMMQALGPIFHLYKDWEDIRVATCLVVARIIQATPHKGLEESILTQCHEDIGHALQQFIQLEEQAVIARAAERDRLRAKIEGGIEGFGDLEPAGGSILSDPGPALVGAEPEKETIVAFDPDQPQAQGSFTEKEHLEFCQELHPSPEDIHDVQSAIEEAAMEPRIEDRQSEEEDGYNPDGPRSYAP